METKATADGQLEFPLRVNGDCIVDRSNSFVPLGELVILANAHPALVTERDRLLMLATDIRNALAMKQAKGRLSGAEDAILGMMREVIGD